MKGIVFSLLITMLMVCAVVYAYDDADFQIWNTDSEEFNLKKNLKITLEEEFRWGDNANQFYYHHYDAGIFYALNKYLNIGGGYRHVYELKKGKFKPENEPYLAATLFFEMQGFTLDSRNRMEYRHFDYQDDSWRYRNKFTLKSPWKFTKMQIQPYAADEIFIGFGDGATEFNQNRFSSGLGMTLTKSLKTEIYYMLVCAKSSGAWIDSNVLGVKLKIAF